MIRTKVAKVELAFALVVALVAAAAFYLPALTATKGVWPAPLDDVYIYFGFARATALGDPLSWLPGNGYSSGATSLLYPLVLAPFWGLGLRGAWLGLASSAIAVAGIVVLARSLATLCHDRSVARWLAAPILLCVPLLDWSLFSGMETGLFALVLGRALVHSQGALDAEPASRAKAQLFAGVWLAALPLVRPETTTLSLALTIAIAHGAQSLGTFPSLARSLGPTVTAVSVTAMVNRALTGEWQAAGALRKLVTAQPFMKPEARVLEIAKNVVVLGHEAFWRALGGGLGALALATLVLAALLARGRRRVAVALVTGALASLALVCLNDTARYQNYRYAAPSLVMLLAAALLGFDALAGHLSLARRRTSAVAALRLAAAGVLGAAVLLLPSREFPRQRVHFAQSSANILEQQGEVASRLARLERRPRRVLVGDAGAIPYLSELPALDALGLGGFHALPFARASTHGMPAVVELIERMDESDRPDVMALYPGWFSGIVEPFGTRIDSVKIRQNVICAADEKVIYRADWSLLAPSGEATLGPPAAGIMEPFVIASLDVADLVSERDHDARYGEPEGGTVIAATRSLPGGTLRYDAGRALPRDVTASIRIPQGDRAGAAATGPANVVFRTDDDGDPRIELTVVRDGRELAAVVAEPVIANSVIANPAVPSASQGDGWRELEAHVPDLAAGDAVTLRARDHAARIFHVTITHPH